MLYDSKVYFGYAECSSKVIKTMAITANKKFWTEFIDIYHHLPCLWNTKDGNYNNRESRSLAWNKLVEKLQQVESNANQDSVKRKINTFRSNFNREVRKVRLTEKEQPTEVYNPTLWYFEHLSFLINQEKYNSSNGVTTDGHYYEEMTLMGLTSAKSEIADNETIQTGTLSQDEATGNETNLHNKKQNFSTLNMANNECDKLLNGTVMNPSADYSTDCDALPKSPISLTLPHTFPSADNYNNNHFVREKSVEAQNDAKSIRLRKAKLRFKSHNPYNKEMKSNLFSSTFTDEAAIYGQAWACGFRKLSPQQKFFAKKAIDEILILGQLKALKLKTVPIDINLLEETRDQG